MTAGNKLVSVDKVSAIITVCSSSTLSIAPIAESNNVIVMSAIATTPLLTNRSGNVFRISSSAVQWANKAAQASRTLNFTTAAIIYEQNDYPLGWKNSFKSAFEALGGKVVAEEAYPTGESDFRTTLIKIKQSKPEMLLIIPLSPLAGSNIVKQLQETQLDAQIMGSEILSFHTFLKNSAGYSDGIYVVTYKYDTESPLFTAFLADYQKKFGRNITEDIYGALGYDAFMLIAKASESCTNADVECIKFYLTNILNKNTTGISGTFYIDENHDGAREYQIRIIENGKLGSVVA